MIRRLLIVLTVAVLSLGACLFGAGRTHANLDLLETSHPSPVALSAKAPGQAIVKLKHPFADIGSSGSDRVKAIGRLVGSPAIESRILAVDSLIDSLPPGKLSPIISGRGLDRILVLRFDPATDVDSVVRELASSGAVEYAEPNYLVKVGGQIPEPANDPDFLEQWGLSNPGFNVNGFGATKGDDIAAGPAWQITTGSPNVVVAVVDTGIDVSHPDLAQNIFKNAGPPPTTGFNVADKDADVSDVLGHGTQMAGIIAAVSNNATGVAGICQCKILPVRFFTQTGTDGSEVVGTVADAAKGILYAIGAGANIINASWDVTASDGEQNQMHALQEACMAANDADVLMVCIAGNDGYDNDNVAVFPGHYQLPNQIVVAASDYNDQIWRTISEVECGFGPMTVQLAAPGVSILSTQARGSCALCTASQNPPDWYTYSTGTSASAAFVSGVAALIKSQFPEANAQLMRNRILAGVDQTWGLSGYVSTGGRLNAYKALTVQLTITPPVLAAIKYKAGKQTLVLTGSEFQQDAQAVVNGVAYPTITAANWNSRVTASIPATAVPKGSSFPVLLRNPDGGTSQTLTLTR